MAGAIGEPLDRVDGRLKVTGQAVYTADWQVPNLAHAVLITSPVAAGRIASIETQAAKQVSGVIAVLTHYDRLPVAQDPSKVRQGEPADRALQLLQDDRVFYAGQPVAVAVAETLEAANEAAGKVVAHYETRKPSITFEDALRRSYVPEKAGGGKDPGEKARGNFQQAMEDAPVKVENIYSTPFHAHNPMEPHATIAVWDGPGKLTLYDTSQGIFGDRARVAGLLGIDAANLRVICLYVGGGFGSKGPTWSHSPLCAMAARHVGRPVKLVVQRPQMFGPVGCRTATQQTISLGASPDGKLLALANETLSHTSTFDEFTETATLPSRMLYSVANNYTVQRLIRSDIGTPSYTRAPGEAPGTFALEIAMDELAYRLGIDPVELRLRNYAERDEDKNLPWSTKTLRECYQRGAERFGWAKRNPEPRSMRRGKTLVGWGMATATYPAKRSAASAVARMYPDGSVHVDAGSQDLGTGTYTIMTQVAADGVGVPVSDVVFRLGDTRFPETPVSGGSQTAASCGTAVYEAARALRDRILSMGREGETLRAIVARSGQPYIEAKASSGPNEEEKKFSSYSFGAQFAEVHVDSDVGQIYVARMTGVFAAGKILNAKTARSQFMGGMVWGISLALQEHSAYDPRLGRIVNNNLAEYHVPVNADVGEIDASWVEEYDPHVSAVGAKGIGEIGITGSAAAVANAIFHATGKRLREAPITPDQLI